MKTEQVSPSIQDLTDAYEGIDQRFKPNLKIQAKSIANSIIVGADTTFQILRKVFPFAVVDLDKAISATPPPTSSPPPSPPLSVITDAKVMFYELTHKLDFMAIISNNYIETVGKYVNEITEANAKKGMFGKAEKFNLAEIKNLLKAGTDKFTDSSGSSVTITIKNYATGQILLVNKKIEAIGALDPTGKDFKYNDLGKNMVLAYLTSELSALNVSANQYMSSSLTSIKGTVESASSVLVNDILVTFVGLVNLATPATVTATQKIDMLTYANSIKLACRNFTPEVTKIYENVQLLQLLALAADSAAEQAKLVADAAAKAAAAEAAAAALGAANAAKAAADNATSSKSTRQAAAAAAAAALVSASTAAAAAQKLLVLANKAKEYIDSVSKYLKFISGVTDQVNPLVDVIVIMCRAESVDTFFAGGGGGRGRRHGHGGKSLMTRRNRLRFKKSRVITRRSSSSRLSRMSRTRNKGVKASTTRKLNGGVVVV